MPPKSYNQLKSSAKNKLATTLNRLEKSGIKINDYIDNHKSSSNYGKFKVSNKQIRNDLGFKGKNTSLEGLKRNIRELWLSKERQEGSVNIQINKAKSLGYRGKGLSQIKNRLRKTSGINTFFDIAKDVQNKFNVSERKSFDITRDILKRAKKSKQKLKLLNQKEKQLLSFFS